MKYTLCHINLEDKRINHMRKLKQNIVRCQVGDSEYSNRSKCI